LASWTSLLADISKKITYPVEKLFLTKTSFPKFTAKIITTTSDPAPPAPSSIISDNQESGSGIYMSQLKIACLFSTNHILYEQKKYFSYSIY